MEGEVLQEVSSTKFLGVIIDKKINLERTHNLYK